VVALALGGCTARTVDGSGTSAAPAPTSAAPAPTHLYYLSLGDSYAAGYQPLASGGGRTTRVGFPYQVVTDARAKGYDYTLVNLACGGATTESVLQTPGCGPHLGPGGREYGPKTQADAAVQFLSEHRGQVGLVTISIGGNDILECGAAANPASCLTSAVQQIGANLATLLPRVRAAAGPDVQIVGTTYPDLFLGGLILGNALARNIANLSVLAFRSLLNPELAKSYGAVGAKFVDVTAATGGYGPLSQFTTLPPYGRIPVPVARICTLTWFCKLHDVHPTPAGHALIARLVVGTLPTR
jgi:lysophospholipase L1-like esterase